MKKTLVAALIAASFSSSVFADSIAIKAAYFQDADDNKTLVAAIEHPIPVLPNFRAAMVSSDPFDYSYENINMIDGSPFTVDTMIDVDRNEFTLYYELLDNSLLHLDLGVGYTQADVAGNFCVTDTCFAYDGDESGAHLYGNVRAPFGESGLGLYATGTAGSIGDLGYLDASAGVTYTLSLSALDLRTYAGYGIVKYTDVTELEAGSDIDLNSVRIGFEIDL